MKRNDFSFCSVDVPEEFMQDYSDDEGEPDDDVEAV